MFGAVATLTPFARTIDFSLAAHALRWLIPSINPQSEIEWWLTVGPHAQQSVLILGSGT